MNAACTAHSAKDEISQAKGRSISMFMTWFLSVTSFAAAIPPKGAAGTTNLLSVIFGKELFYYARTAISSTDYDR
jgi:hypothetical protein